MSLARRKEMLSDLVLHEVPSEVRGTMTEDQIKAVRIATEKRHAVDVRFTVPLLFTTLYFVLLVGKDTRTETTESNRERRTSAGFHLSTTAIAVGTAVAVITTAVVLYIIKSRSGIDLFPDSHAPFSR